MQQPSDEIKSRLDIVDVLREYIPLKPAGINFRVLCPFHREKNPSFVVSSEKQIWHCFGCGKGGDIFSFIMEMEGINFVEALRVLAPKAGVTLKRQDPKLSSQRNRLLDILEYSKKYYYRILMDSPQAENARKYLKERGLTEDTIEEWRLGYSPDSWDDVINLLRSKGFNDNEIFLAGMSVKKDRFERAAANGVHANENKVSRFYNRFRGRIMFPINDVNGNAVAFSARVSPENEKEEKMGKYINSPQTMIYEKSRILFGLYQAKTFIKNEDLAIIVEGQMDVITAHKSGFRNIIASSGTALTKDQIKILKRYSDNIALAFDMDEAGQLAADRGIKEAMQAEMNIKVILLPSGNDPDECIRNSPEEWRNAVKSAKSMMQYYFDKVFSELNLEKIEDRRLAAKKLLNIIIQLGNKIERDFWLKKLSEKIDVAENILRELISTKRINAVQNKQDDNIRENRIIQSREEMLSELLLALIMKFPSRFDYAVNNIYIDQISGIANKVFYKNLIIYYNNIKDSGINNIKDGIKVNYNNFKNWLENFLFIDKGNELSRTISDANSGQLKLFDKLILLGDKDYYNLSKENVNSEINKIIVYLKRFYLINRMKEIEKLIIQSEKISVDLKELIPPPFWFPRKLSAGFTGTGNAGS